MPEPDRIAGTRPLASCMAHLREIDARLEALSDACTRRCEALLVTLQHLPQAAGFEPFPTTTPAAASAPAQVSQPRSRPRKSSQTPSDSRTVAPSPRPDPGQGAFAGVAQALAAASQPGARAAMLAKGALQDLTSGNPAAVPGGLAALPQAAGLLVADLLARVPTPLTPGHPRQAAQPGGQPNQPHDPAEVRFSRMLDQLVAQGTGRPPAHQSAPARQSKRKPTSLGPAVVQAVAQALARHPDLPPQAGMAGLAEGLAQTLPALLPHLLADLAPAPSAGATRQTPGPAASSRSPAPRAQARLVEGTPQAKPSGGGQKSAPASDPQSAENGGELAGQLNRLLLDQAWLRGVDLT